MELSPRRQLEKAISEDGRLKWWLHPVTNKAFARRHDRLGIYVEFFGNNPERPWRVRTIKVSFTATAEEAIEQVNAYLKELATK